MHSQIQDSRNLIGPLLQKIFMEHLVNHKQVSPRTIKSYRDTFKLLLQYLRDVTGRQPAALCISDLDAPAILQFLEHLERQRHNQAQSRNVRLTAIRSFFRLVALQCPESLGVVTRVLAIPRKQTDKHLIGFLTRPEIEAILAAPDLSKWTGRRDQALLLTLYNTGARVSEITALQQRNFSFGVKSFVQLMGKGRKERAVPLWPSTAKTLQEWFRALGDHKGVAFPSARGRVLTRDGVNYILQRAVQRAAEKVASLRSKSIGPHTVRHTCALHLLQSGVDITVIALWLGHETIHTTHGYIEADLLIKERALQKLAPTSQPLQRFKATDAVLAFLASL